MYSQRRHFQDRRSIICHIWLWTNCVEWYFSVCGLSLSSLSQSKKLVDCAVPFFSVLHISKFWLTCMTSFGARVCAFYPIKFLPATSVQSKLKHMSNWIGLLQKRMTTQVNDTNTFRKKKIKKNKIIKIFIDDHHFCDTWSMNLISGSEKLHLLSY